MKYLNRYTVPFLAILLSCELFAQANSFNAVLSLKTSDNTDGKNALVVGVAAEKNEAKYKLMVDSYGEALGLSEGSQVLTGKADVSIRQEHYIPLDVIGEGDGEISVRIYAFTDSMDVDPGSKREFFVKYSVKRRSGTENYNIVFSGTKERQESPKQYGQANAASAPTGSLTMTEMQEVVGTSPDNVQKFVINTQKRYNNLFRSLLFIASFFILGFLCYRILTKKR